MSKSERARVAIGSMLGPSETIGAVSTAQAKVEGAAPVMGDTATGAGAIRLTVPPQVWVVVTDRRVLLFRDGRNGGGPLVGALVFEAARQEVSVALESRVRHRVVISDTTDQERVVRLNVGLAKGRATALVDAARQPQPLEEPVVRGDLGVVDLRPGDRLPDGRTLSASEWLQAVRDADGRYG